MRHALRPVILLRMCGHSNDTIYSCGDYRWTDVTARTAELYDPSPSDRYSRSSFLARLFVVILGYLSHYTHWAKFSKEIRRRNCCSACLSLCLTLETILKRIFPKLGRRSDICKTLTLSDLRMQYRIRRWGHFSLKCRFAYANEDLSRSTKLLSIVVSA